MQTQKDRAGKGNMVNPLELSPATSELSHVMSEEYTSKSEKRKPGMCRDIIVGGRRKR
jgi:hypothetical protein